MLFRSNRIIDAFPVNQQAQIRVQLATGLMAVLSQQLLPRIDKVGMMAAYEFLLVTPAIANLIRENKVYRIDSSIQTGKKFGMQLLDDHLRSEEHTSELQSLVSLVCRLLLEKKTHVPT